MMQDDPGQNVGPYRIREVLGRGGMGIVYHGVHERLEREVAIKQLVPELTQNPQFRERFFSEAKTQAQLQHPSIVTIYDLLEEDGEYYIVMEYFSGDGLDHFIGGQPGHSLGEERSLHIFRQVLEALDAAHSLGVIHRDVKPSNVLVGEGDRVKLMDFGIALLVGDKRLTQSSQTIGTPVYMSPEQIVRPREVDHRTDIYSAAVMLYEMLAGVPPFDAETEYEIKKQHIELPAARPLELLEGTTPAVVEALLRALDKDPGQRFASAGEFLRALPGPGGGAAAPEPSPRPTVHEQPLPPGPPPPAPAAKPAATGPATGAGPLDLLRKPAVWAGTGIAGLVLVALLLFRFPAGDARPAPSEAAPPAERPEAQEVVPADPPRQAPETDVVQVPGERSRQSGPSSPEPEPRQEEAPPPVPARPEPPRPSPTEREAEIRQRKVQQVRGQVQVALSAAEGLLEADDLEGARSRVRQAVSLSAPYRGDMVDEVVRLELLDQRITERILTQRTAQESAREKTRLAREALEARLAEIEGLIDDGKYPEARNLARGLMEQDSVPEEVAQRARDLDARAEQELKSVWGEATVTEESNEKINPRTRDRQDP